MSTRGFRGGLPVEVYRLVGDIGGQVADPLQVGVDLEHGQDQAEVDRRRLPGDQHPDALVVDLDLQVVENSVFAQDLLGEVRVRVLEGAHRFRDGLDGQSAISNNLRLDVFELLLKMRCHRLLPESLA